MAEFPPRRFNRNVPGDWYTTGECMACGAPEHEAPELFSPLTDDDSDTYFVRQPSSPAEVEHACRAARSCCVTSVRYGGRDPEVIARLDNTGEYCDFVVGDDGTLRSVRHVVLLPGLDGTGALFDGFVRSASRDMQLDVIALPQEPVGYAELAEWIAPRLKLTPQTILLAESFSGPLAIQIAQSRQIAGLVLCNSFVAAPGPRAFAALPWTPLLHLPLPGMFIRRYLVGPDASDALVERVRAVVGSVPPSVLASRVSSVLRVDVAAALGRCSMPILYLRGTEDRAVPEASVRTVVDAAPTLVTVARIPGPHLLLQASPDAAWHAIERFVREPHVDTDGVARRDADVPI